MSYETWVNLFGRSTLDQDLRAALAEVGLPEGPEIERGDIYVLEDFEGLSVGFKVADLVKGGEVLGDGVSILLWVTMWLAGEDELYKGDLPYGITRDDSQKSLRQRFGPPTEEDEEDREDEWVIDRRVLRASYTDDYAALKAVTILADTDV